MDPWLSSDFHFATKLKPSLPSFGNLRGQADQLIGRMEGSGARNFVIVAHSQGGLIGRSATQRRGDLSRGLITIGTPHRGAALATNSRSAVANLMAQRFNDLYRGCHSPYDDPGCHIAAFLGTYVAYYALDFTFDSALPATGDLQPGSTFLDNLNTTPEYFTRIGIQSYADKRWVLARLIAESIPGCNPDHRGCGGRAWARYVDWSYNGFRLCAGIAAFTGDFETMLWCGNIALSMDRIDGTWNTLTAPGQERTDGIVQGSSQVYPNAIRQYPIGKGDSHSGETKSDKVRPRVREALDVYFNVPRRN
jgi:pimeloyl-ACP methyl ester carboxylesterase